MIGAYLRALDDTIDLLEKTICKPVDINDKEQMMKIIKSCIGTKIIKKWEGVWSYGPIRPFSPDDTRSPLSRLEIAAGGSSGGGGKHSLQCASSQHTRRLRCGVPAPPTGRRGGVPRVLFVC